MSELREPQHLHTSSRAQGGILSSEESPSLISFISRNKMQVAPAWKVVVMRMKATQWCLVSCPWGPRPRWWSSTSAALRDLCGHFAQWEGSWVVTRHLRTCQSPCFCHRSERLAASQTIATDQTAEIQGAGDGWYKASLLISTPWSPPGA